MYFAVASGMQTRFLMALGHNIIGPTAQVGAALKCEPCSWLSVIA